MKDIKDICEIIWLLENKYNLIEFEIDGVKPWQYRRMALYYLISEKIDVLEQAHARLSKKEKILSLYGLVKNSILYNPFFNKKVNTLIFPNERSKIVENEYIDIYTKYLEDELLKKTTSFCTLERPFLGKHIRKPNANKKYLDFIVLFSNLFKNFLNVTLNEAEKKICKNLQEDIKNYFDIEINIESFFIENVKKFKINYYFYIKLLKKLDPKKIYIVISYAHGDLIKAAKDLNIEVIEIQHGTFSKYHLGYSFPNLTNKISYFPDKLLVWNDYWKNLINLPIDKSNIIIRPFKYLENTKLNYLHLKKIDNQVVILSQGALGEKIANAIYNNYELFKDKNIIYKLHPGEYERWNNYPSLIKLSKKENVKIVKDIDLYKILATSDTQVGVFSTALYEGIAFNCKTILIDLPGIEYMDTFIKYNNLEKQNIFYMSTNAYSF